MDKPNKDKDTDKTVKESYEDSSTFHEGFSLKTWRGFSIVDEFPAEGGEADIYVISDGGLKQVLKLYRKGMEPKEIVLSNIKELSERFSEHVVRIYEYGYDRKSQRWYEIQEFAPFGSLREYMKKNKISEPELRTIIEEINEALGVLHRFGIIHRDLKPSNILIRSVNPMDIVFTDFGISSIIEEDVSKKLTTVKGTPIYSAPESFSGILGKEVDYWALGMIVYEILTGRNPFLGLSMQSILYRLTTEDVRIPEVSREYQQLLMGLLTREPKRRWGYEEVNDWLKGKHVPVYYGQELKSMPKYNVYKFMDREFYEPEVLALAFVESNESFEMAKRHLTKDYVRLWFSKMNDIDRVMWIDDITENSKTPEEIVVRFTYSYHRNLPLTLYGRNICADYVSKLVLFASHEQVSECDRKNYELLRKSGLSKIIEVYEELTGNPQEGLLVFVKNVEKSFSEDKIELLQKVLYFYEVAQKLNKSIPDKLNPYKKDFKLEVLSEALIQEILSKLTFSGEDLYWGNFKLNIKNLQSDLSKIFEDPRSIEKVLDDEYVRLIFSNEFLEIVSHFTELRANELRIFSKSVAKQIDILKKSKLIDVALKLLEIGVQPKIAIIDAGNIIPNQML